jgi:hypothetical protein
MTNKKWPKRQTRICPKKTLHNDEKKRATNTNNDQHKIIWRKDLVTQKCWWFHQVIFKDIVVTNIVKFQSLLLILKPFHFRVCNYNQLVYSYIKTFDISTLCRTIISHSQLEDILQNPYAYLFAENNTHVYLQSDPAVFNKKCW